MSSNPPNATVAFFREFLIDHPKVKWGAIAVAALMLLGLGRCAFGQSVTLTSDISTAPNRATPSLTLAIANPGTRVITCTASGGWTGAKTPGAQLQPEITATTTYTISCSAPAITADTIATLSWIVPTTNTDGSAYTNPKGFLVYAANTAAALATVTPRNHFFPTSTGTPYTGLTPGSWFFCVKAVSLTDATSSCSNVSSKTIAPGVPAWSDTKSVTVTITPTVPNPPTQLQVVAQAAHAVDLKVRDGKVVYLLAKQVGTVPLGTPCRRDFGVPGTDYWRVDANQVTFNSPSVKTFLPVARCQVQPVQVEVG
jgi:hypothetical protein